MMVPLRFIVAASDELGAKITVSTLPSPSKEPYVAGRCVEDSRLTIVAAVAIHLPSLLAARRVTGLGWLLGGGQRESPVAMDDPPSANAIDAMIPGADLFANRAPVTGSRTVTPALLSVTATSGAPRRVVTF
jgi:hypothetical protein